MRKQRKESVMDKAMDHIRSQAKKKVNAAEKELAKEMNGWQVPNSGSIDEYKGDVSTDQLLIDLKTTEMKSITVTLEMLAKISREAREAGRDPALVLQFFNNESNLVSDKWVVVPLDDYLEMTYE